MAENENVDDFEQDELIEDDDLDVEIVEEDDDFEGGDAPEADDPDAPADEDEPEAEEASGDVDDADEDADLKRLPTKVSDVVRQRLERERRKFAAVQNEVVNEREKIRAAAIHVAKIAQSHETELTTLKKQNAALQHHFAETLEYAYNRDIEGVSAQLRRAREDSDYDAIDKLEGRVAELRHTMRQIQEQKRTLPDPDQIQHVSAIDTTPVPMPHGRPLQQTEPPAPKAVDWLKRNKSWFFKPEFSDYAEAVKRIDNKIAAAGYNKNSDEYYKELDRRVDKMFPQLRKRKTGSTGSPVGPAGATPARNVSKSTVRITPKDKAVMRRFGMDPTNRAHLLEFARSKSRPAAR